MARNPYFRLTCAARESPGVGTAPATASAPETLSFFNRNSCVSPLGAVCALCICFTPQHMSSRYRDNQQDRTITLKATRVKRIPHNLSILTPRPEFRTWLKRCCESRGIRGREPKRIPPPVHFGKT